MPGVTDVSVSYEKRQVTVVFDDTKTTIEPHPRNRRCRLSSTPNRRSEMSPAEQVTFGHRDRWIRHLCREPVQKSWTPVSTLFAISKGVC